MAQITVQPIKLGKSLLSITSGSTEVGTFEKHVSQVQFNPTSSQVAFKGLGENTHTFSTVATWVLVLAYAQDWATPNSLSRYLHEHEGETVEMEFEPVAGGPAITAEVHIAPGSIGGQVDAVATATVTLGVNGKPALGIAA